jgi:predicted esterase
MLMLALVLWLSSQTAFSANVPLSPKVGLQSSHQPDEIPKGQVVEKMVCADAPDQTYALYLPTSYSPKRKWPVLYAFDPGARGRVPVERFKEAAERFGWIVAGSNNSRNGPSQPSAEALSAIVKDTQERFAIDDNRAYLTGLSGGARLVFHFAIGCQGCIAGVIACGAGFPVGVSPSPALHFAVFSTTGTEDFNFGEVKTLDEALEKAGMIHRTEVFTGRHEWLPSSVAVDALEWMELQAMKSGKRQRDANLIESIWQTRMQQAQVLEDSQKTYEAYQLYFGLQSSFRGLRDVAAVEKKTNQLRDSAEVKSGIRNEQQQIKKQREIESRIDILLAARQQRSKEAGPDGERSNQGLDPETRLTGMFAELRKQAGGTEESDQRRVARRVLEGVFIGLFEQGANQLQTQKRFDEAVRTFKLATEVNPERAGAFFYLAWAYASNGNKKQALRALQTAVDKGFSDLAAIEGTKAFDSIHDESQYQQIIQTIRSKP